MAWPPTSTQYRRKGTMLSSHEGSAGAGNWFIGGFYSSLVRRCVVVFGPRSS